MTSCQMRMAGARSKISPLGICYNMAALSQDDWFFQICLFRQSPADYLTSLKVDEETFTLDLLQVES